MNKKIKVNKNTINCYIQPQRFTIYCHLFIRCVFTLYYASPLSCGDWLFYAIKIKL